MAKSSGNGTRLKSDKQNTTAHIKDSLTFNTAHAIHHTKEAEHNAKRLKEVQKRVPLKDPGVQAELKKLATTKKRLSKLKGT